MNCTRCDCTGWLNLHCLPPGIDEDDFAAIQVWFETPDGEASDVCPCDCCDGSGEHIKGDETWSHGRVPECI